MKKHILLYFLLFFLTEYCYAQTYIKPIIGRDFTKLENIYSERMLVNGVSYIREYNMPTKGFRFNSMMFGVKIEKQVDTRYSIALTSSYTQKKVGATFFNIAPITGYVFNYFRNQLGVNYQINDFVYFGVGGNANVMSKFRYMLINNELRGDLGHFLKEFGINGVAGIHFKNIELELYYLHNLTTHEEDDGLNLKPIQSLGATLGYKIRL